MRRSKPGSTGGSGTGDAGASRELVQDAARITARRIAGMIRPLADSAIPMAGSAWTVGEAAAHLAYTKRLMARLAAGEPAPHGDGSVEGFSHANAEALRAFPERGGAALADEILSAVDQACRAVSSRPAGELLDTPAGTMTVDTLMSYLLCHLLMHGEPMAAALGEPSLLDTDVVLRALPFIFHALQTFYDSTHIQGLQAGYEIRLRGGPAFWVAFRNGEARLSLTPAGGVDCHISADPVAFFKVGTGMLSQWSAISTGKMIAWGAKPWLALRFVRLFSIP